MLFYALLKLGIYGIIISIIAVCMGIMIVDTM